MKILIDGDGCPVVQIAVECAKRHGVACTVLCDTAHELQLDGAETVVVSKGADSVDFALVNTLRKGDIVITQDYGLAAMCLARQAFVLNQNGMEYTDFNIDSLLLSRHTARKIRNAGGRLKGPSKRRADQDEAFISKLEEMLGR